MLAILISEVYEMSYRKESESRKVGEGCAREVVSQSPASKAKENQVNEAKTGSKSALEVGFAVGNVVGDAVPFDGNEWEMEGDFEITIRVSVSPEDGSMERGASEQANEAIAMLKEKLEVAIAEANECEHGFVNLIGMVSERFSWKFNPCEVGRCEMCEDESFALYRTSMQVTERSEVESWKVCLKCKVGMIEADEEAGLGRGSDDTCKICERKENDHKEMDHPFHSLAEWKKGIEGYGRSFTK